MVLQVKGKKKSLKTQVTAATLSENPGPNGSCSLFLKKNTGPFPRLLLTAAPRLNLKVLIETHGFLGLSKHVNADSY